MTVKMVVTDLDGTLLRDDKSIDSIERTTFENLGKKGVVRVAATGRSLYSISKVIPDDFPFDYVVFSTGSGIINFKTRQIMNSNGLTAQQTEKVAHLFKNENLDFTVHFPIPENHCFNYFQQNPDNVGFNSYREFYKEFCQPINFSKPFVDNTCQLLTIMNLDIERFNGIKSKLNGYKVIRTTSPIDHSMMWMEVFPENVSKGHAIHWLCEYLGIEKESVLAIGNDFNDIDVLDYVGHARLVENSHPELKERYPLVSSNNENGVSKAIQLFFDL
jgi:hypothetical protein